MLIPSELYGQIVESIPVSCVDVVIVNDGHYLLVKRGIEPEKGRYWLPGGRVLKNEMMAQAVRRKCVEEVNLPVHVGPILLTAETVFQKSPWGPIHTINSCFLAISYGDDRVVVDDTIEDHKWVETITPDLHPYVQECLRRAGF